jgi:hypothetical protein
MIRDPFAFSGRRRRNLFEGWYCKNVSADGVAYSFIPGISFPASGEGHAFVQVIRGSDGETAYVTYPVEEFSASRREFDVRVGPNRFGFDGATLSLESAFDGISGSLGFSGIRRLQERGAIQRIMGWYRLVPFMECYHEVGSLSHSLSGSLQIGDRSLSFDGGRGYLEKDWGSSMPSAWIWLECNGFPTADASVMLSVARIPWLGKSFTGFLGFLALPEHVSPVPIRFGTYSGATISSIDVDGNRLRIVVELGTRTLRIDATRSTSGMLSAPVAGGMDRRIAESINSEVTVTVQSADGTTEWEASGTSAGVELVGVIDSLMPK